MKVYFCSIFSVLPSVLNHSMVHQWVGTMFHFPRPQVTTTLALLTLIMVSWSDGIAGFAWHQLSRSTQQVRRSHFLFVFWKEFHFPCLVAVFILPHHDTHLLRDLTSIHGAPDIPESIRLLQQKLRNINNPRVVFNVLTIMASCDKCHTPKLYIALEIDIVLIVLPLLTHHQIIVHVHVPGGPCLDRELKLLVPKR